MNESSKKLALVTGGAGFVGSHLCRALKAKGHRVISLDNYFTGSKENHVEGVEYREGHTKDISKHISETPDIIYHLGEYARVEQSVLEPEVVHDLNTVGTDAVLAFWQEKICKLVYAGSSTKFGDEGRTKNTSPYASTKAENTEKVRAIGDLKKIPYAITYFYNVYGPGERSGIYGTLIEAFKQMYLQGAPLTVVSPGTQLRNFTHVDDIVDGLLVIGQKGQGDEFGLGNEKSYSVIEVARMLEDDIVMLPERAANRMGSSLDTSKAKALGWRAKRSLAEYVASIKAQEKAPARERRVLIFSTTFFPIEGPAEKALYELIQKLPSVQFDIITTRFLRDDQQSALTNAAVYRLGVGSGWDKYLLPFLGYRKAKQLSRKHSYLFAWALLASYGGLAGVLLKSATDTPLLITLADQNLEQGSFLKRSILMMIMRNADQVYGLGTSVLRRSLGVGDAFANQLRYVYVDLFKQRT